MSSTSPLVAWRGPSLLDGGPIRVVVYTLDGSDNQKTGPVVQVGIFRDDVPPHVARKRRLDISCCGDCAIRAVDACYTRAEAWEFRTPWARTCDAAADLEAACRAVRESGLPLRIGSIGDPGAAPFEVIQALANAARAQKDRPRHTGFTHQWKHCDQRLKAILMGSVESVRDAREAQELGWRTFRVRADGMPAVKGEVVCPATPAGGKKTTCAQCLICSGVDSRCTVNVVVNAHGDLNKIAKIGKLITAVAAKR